MMSSLGRVGEVEFMCSRRQNYMTLFSVSANSNTTVMRLRDAIVSWWIQVDAFYSHLHGHWPEFVKQHEKLAFLLLDFF